MALRVGQAPYTRGVGDDAPEPQTIHPPSLVRERATGTPRVLVTASVDWLYEGYVGACARFQEVEDARREARETFIPLFEALNWAVSFEDLIREQRDAPLEDDLVLAVRYARNRVHHQWAAALNAVEQRFGPVQAPGGSKIVGTHVEWFWKPLEVLPDPPHWRPDRKRRTAYAERLADRSVRPTLRELQDIFDRARP